MQVLIVGGGGREHAIAKAIAKNPKVTKLWAAPGNGGIAELCECVPIKATDVEGMVRFAREQVIDYVIVTPDDPLCLGMVDALKDAGIPAFGPDRKAAMIEGSKAFAKDLMKRYGIPTADFETFRDRDEAVAYLDHAAYPIVIKADGLALGKGVSICATREEAVAAVDEMMLGHKFGASGDCVVIESCLSGPEVSVLAFTDGKTIKPMVSSMDHKRAFDHDEGPNTGGMGTIAPNPFYTPEVAERCMKEIFLPTIQAMNVEGRPFKGCLYFGLMITADGPKVIEYNCRFGDPETQVVLPLLQSDLLDIMMAVTNGTLDEADVTFSDGSACCVILASGGYPVKYQSGFPIEGLSEAEKSASVYHAGTKLAEDGRMLTAGGRVLGVTATALSLAEAVQAGYQAANRIHFEGLHRREDIGQKALEVIGS